MSRSPFCLQLILLETWHILFLRDFTKRIHLKRCPTGRRVREQRDICELQRVLVRRGRDLYARGT